MMASSATIKVPPVFNESEMDYEQWKKDISLWVSFTDLPETKHGIAVHLSLTGRARKASSELSVDHLKSSARFQYDFEVAVMAGSHAMFHCPAANIEM
jgi:hypothetical protein